MDSYLGRGRGGGDEGDEEKAALGNEGCLFLLETFQGRAKVSVVSLGCCALQLSTRPPCRIGIGIGIGVRPCSIVADIR